MRCDRIDAHAVHLRQVDHQALLAHRLAGEAVAAAAHRQQQLVRRRELHRLHDVGGAAAARDQRRMAIEGAVPDAPRGVVAGAVAQQQLAAQARREILDVAPLRMICLPSPVTASTSSMAAGVGWRQTTFRRASSAAGMVARVERRNWRRLMTLMFFS